MEDDITPSEYEGAYKRALEDISQATDALGGGDVYSGPKKPKPVYSSAADFDAHLDEELFHLIKYSSDVLTMPAATEVKFTVVRLPIVALFDPFVTVDQIKFTGFEVTNIGLYPIQLNQMVLAVSRTYKPTVNKHLEISKGDRVIVTEPDGSQTYWFATVVKVGPTKVILDFDSGDDGVAQLRTTVVALLNDEVAIRGSEGVTKPLPHAKLTKYAQGDLHTSGHDYQAVAERMSRKILSRPEGKNLALYEEQPFTTSAALPGYQLYWLYDTPFAEN